RHRRVRLTLPAGAALARAAHRRHEHHELSPLHRLDDPRVRAVVVRLRRGGGGGGRLVPGTRRPAALGRLRVRRRDRGVPDRGGGREEAARALAGTALVAAGRRGCEHDRGARAHRGVSRRAGVSIRSLRSLLNPLGCRCARYSTRWGLPRYTRPSALSHSAAMSAGERSSTVEATLSATRPSGVSLALTALITSASSSASSAFTSGTTCEARKRPFGSARVTRSSVWMRGSAL